MVFPHPLQQANLTAIGAATIAVTFLPPTDPRRPCLPCGRMDRSTVGGVCLPRRSLLTHLRCACSTRRSLPCAEFGTRVGMNYLFAPWISWLVLLQATPFLRPDTPSYHMLWWAISLPILVLDVKVYGQWFTRGISSCPWWPTRPAT
ncbi:hypothetical protein ZWY2020_003380 [Hordeum vulgare]|nr:hypothetical protein ZWY2020_003380 [Hordeum vulgare]